MLQESLIAEAVALAVEGDLAGWNLDLEIGAKDQGNASLVSEAGEQLVKFVDPLARALHQHGKVLSLDIATADYAWWNATALNATALDFMCDMSTYHNFADFIVSLGIALLDWSPEKIGVGFSDHGNQTERELRCENYPARSMFLRSSRACLGKSSVSIPVGNLKEKR